MSTNYLISPRSVSILAGTALVIFGFGLESPWLLVPAVLFGLLLTWLGGTDGHK